MKTLSKLKLNQLNQDELTEREMEYLRGGSTPGNCDCYCNNPELNSSDAATSLVFEEGPSGNVCRCSITPTSLAGDSISSPEEVTSGCVCGCVYEGIGGGSPMAANEKANMLHWALGPSAMV